MAECHQTLSLFFSAVALRRHWCLVPFHRGEHAINAVCKDPRFRRGLLTPSLPKESACFLGRLPQEYSHLSIHPSYGGEDRSHAGWATLAVVGGFFFYRPLSCPTYPHSPIPFIRETSRFPLVGLSPCLLPFLSSSGLLLAPERPSEP